MNFIFRSYPAHPWFAEWTFEPRGCSASFRASGSGRFFQSREAVGQITAHAEAPQWRLQIPVPQNSRTHMLFNGFCAYYERKNNRTGAEVIIPEPGIIWGRFENIPEPVIVSDLPVQSDGASSWLETDSGLVLLTVKDGRFCLVNKSPAQAEAARTADAFLAKDLDAALQSEREKRSGVTNLLEEMSHHDELAVISAESMMKALRPPEGSIPNHWTQSAAADTPRMDINELFFIAPAWRWMDVRTAEELVLCGLKLQTNAGAIPVQAAPHASFSTIEAPKPLLSQTTETIYETGKSHDFLAQAIPLLRRHLQWQLHHFDPKRQGVFCWKSAAESVVPGLYESDLATVDLTVLLISEIDALNRLRKQSAAHREGDDWFSKERDTLERNILEQFWNEKEKAFVNAFLRDKESQVHGFPAFTPLLWKNLPHTYRTSILESIHESGKLPGGLSVLSWRKSAMDDNSFPLLQQMLVFQALKIADPHGQLLNDFSRVTLQGFVEWHTLALEEENRLPINPALGAFIMTIQALRQYRYHAKGGITGYAFKLLRRFKADRFDLGVVAATLFTVLSVHLIYGVLHAPPPFDMLEAQMNSAYAEQNIAGTLENCYAIIKHYPDDADTALQLAANISMLNGRFKEASEYYQSVREKHPDSPGPMIALGLAYQLQGRFAEAEQNYYEFCYIFEEIFPKLVGEVNHFRYLMHEGFKSPPKWEEIYRYQLMHEL